MSKDLYMIEEYEKRKRKQVASMRSLLDYGIGIVIACAGVFFFIRDKLNLEINRTFEPNLMDKFFGVICVLYGGWRIYRGYKKNYFR